MKKTYYHPTMDIIVLGFESLIAVSQIENGGDDNGSGTPEVKSNVSSSYSNPVNWDDEWK